ncbi:MULTISPECIES: rhomboid family intramembrane serine protease [Weeksella]|uniref:rhomboid family intramembrane serine protease n=1 Tax=Weeksella TaxID=1013 RepID=UPI0008A4F233|nr:MULTISPECIES: rhomboid family intramembrane serine protease [Weeksella]MDK7374883.1 rhomboid family intramembrane serine protease [Weeksella virosa]OFM83920.1 rhomboid family intramembrane serine protease [Weeksella sp. HMSC059D05]
MVNGILDELKLKYKSGNIATKLIYINIIFFFTILIVGFVLKKIFPSFQIDNIIALSSQPNALIKHPWSIFTYAFLHGELWHLFLNMLLLYYISSMFLRYFRDQDFLTFYILGILGGALFYCLFAGYFSSGSSYLVGSSAAIYATFFGLVSYNPKIPVRLLFFPNSFPILYIAFFLLGLDVYQIIDGRNSGGSLSHFGGAAVGYLYMKQFEKGNDFIGQRIREIRNFFNQKKKTTFKTYTNQTTNKPNEQKKSREDYEFNAQKVAKQQKIDAILDKISRSGYESLTKEEKDFLFREGR